MKKKLILLSFALLSACTMNAKNIETTCYSHKSFKDLTNCISEEVAKTDNKSISSTYYERYVIAAKMLELEVRNKKTTDEEARILLSMVRNNLEEEAIEKFPIKLGGRSATNNSVDELQNGYNVRESVLSPIDNKVYNADECIGAVVMGKCHGSVINKGGYKPTCHGEWMNGMCTGAMF